MISLGFFFHFSWICLSIYQSERCKNEYLRFSVCECVCVYVKRVAPFLDRIEIQLNPALTDFKGLTNFIYYKRNSVKAIIGNEKKTAERTRDLYPLKAKFR